MDEKYLALTFLISGTLFFVSVMCLAEIRLADRQARNLRRAQRRERVAPTATP